ncbi:Melanoma inhibitory activity protein 2 [Merluccius polli]|uniref:Melanoma inhibitory activity protein 2 n=1 Tax=Merluccius polli TaxID=89951 RepID=A0AA47P958_MERPO|nr:Melanoma inhibitory activity protein 2 [Merluccius polli]
MAILQFCRRLYSAGVILFFSPYLSWCLLSDYKICGDPECESPMSRVQATKDHHGKDCRFLSFTSGDTIFVYHKLTGRRQDLWAGSIDKQFGYFPKDSVKEEQVYATAEKVVETQKFDFFCLDDNGYPIDSSHLETKEDDGNVDDQGNKNSETNHGGLDTKLREGGSYSTSQELFQLNHKSVLSESNRHTEGSSRTLENMESGDGSGDKQGPNEQVTGLLGMPQGSEHVEKEDEEAKAEEGDDSLTSSVTQWLGLGGQGEIDETTLGHEKEDKERTEMGEAGGAFTLTVNSWLGYGNGKTEDAEKSVKVEIVEEEEKKERFRSRKLALDLESHQLQEEELAIPGTFDWLGDTLSSTIGFGLTHQDSGLKKTSNKEKVENTNKEVKSSPSHSWYDIGIGDVLGFGNDAGKFDSKQQLQQQQQQQQHNEKEIITDNKVETKTEMLSAGVNSEEYSVSSVSNTNDFPLEQSQEESKIKTELRDTVPLDGDSDIDDVLDSRSMLIADNESEVANLDEDNTLQSELEKNHPTVLPSDRFLSMLDNVLSLDEDVDDNDEGGETKAADEKDSAQTKHGHDPDLTQYSLRSENNEGSVEAGLDGNADKHEEGNTKTGTLNPGVAQTNTVGEEIFASTQFHDTMQQSQGDNRYEGDSKETAQATDDGLNTLEAEELISSHREALSDSVARKLKETEMNEIMTHVNKVELKTDAALDQPRSNEADVSQHMLRYSEDNKSSFPSPDILTFGIVDRYTNMDTIDQSSSPPSMSGSAERGDNDTDSLNLDISNTGAETDDEHSITEDQTAEVTAVFEKETFHESGELSVPLFEIAKSLKSTTGVNTIGDTVFGTEHSSFSNMANLKQETQVETQRKDEVKEEQQVEKETKIVVNLQIGNDKEDENIDEGEDKESLDGNPAMENHSSVIRDNNSKVRATEGMNLDQITLDEPQREGESDDFMVSVKATDAGAAWAGADEANSIDDEISHMLANSRGESPETLDVETEMKRGYMEKENHVEGKEEGKNSKYSDTLREEQEREEHHEFMGSKSDESESSYNSGHISEHIKRRSKSELDSDDKVSGLFVSQTGIVKQEEVNVDKTSPGRLFNDKVINPQEIYDQKHSDLDTPGEKSSFNNVVLGPTKEFQPEDNYKLYSGVATFPEPSTDEMTKSDQQSDNTDQGTTIGKEEENKNSENCDISITEQSDSMVTNSDDDVKNSASHNGAVFSEQAVFIDSMAPTPTVENKDTVQSESGGWAFGMFKNAFSYFSPTPSAERQDFKLHLDSSSTEKTSQPGGSLSSEQVKHFVEDTTPAMGVVPDAPTSFHTLQVQHQETSIPMPSAQYQSQSNFDSCSQHPTPEVPNKAGTVTFPKKHKALHAHFSVEETALLTELFGQHKLQWLDFILSNIESMDNDLSILLDMENLLHHVDKLAQRQNTAKTRELTSLKKLKILLSRVKDILNTGKSDIEDGISTPCLSRHKDKLTAIEGEPRKTKGSSESVSDKTPTSSGVQPHLAPESSQSESGQHPCVTSQPPPLHPRERGLGLLPWLAEVGLAIVLAVWMGWEEW